jgi:polar amino acid transport system substrate-binding protein
MKRILFFLLCATVPGCLAASAETIIFNVGYENAAQPPYYMGKDQVLQEKPGVAVEMVQLLEQKIPGLKVQLFRYPWIRCTQYLEDGRLDGIFNASFKEERLHIGHYPWKNGSVSSEKRITTISYALYVRNQSPIFWDGTTITNLGKEQIGAPRGYSIVGDLQEKGYDVLEVNTTRQIMMMLQNRRIGAGAMQLVTADTLLKNEPQLAANIHRIDLPLADKPYYLMISNQFYDKYPEMSEKIWTAIEELRNESFDEISRKYMDD